MSSNTIASRREERRRKILENAEHRLKKISGNDSSNIKEEDTSCSKENGMLYSSDTASNSYLGNGGTDSHRVRHSENNLLHNELSNKFNENVEQLLNEDISVERQEDKVLKATQESLTQHICLICLAVVVRVLFAMDLGYLIANNIIVPFILTTVSSFILTKKRPTPFVGFLRPILLLSGVSPEKVSYFFEFFVIINQIFLDFSVYIFAFVTVHVLVGSLWTR